MAGRDDCVTWLHVKDEDIDEVGQLRVTVSAVEEGEGEKEKEALPMQGYPSRQLEGGGRGGLQALRCDAQSRPAALRGCSAGPEAEVAGGLSKAEKEAGGRQPRGFGRRKW